MGRICGRTNANTILVGRREKGGTWKLRHGREDVQVAGGGVDLICLVQNRGQWASY